MSALLDVQDLTIRFATPDGEVVAADRIGFGVGKGETVGLVGESGSGKSQTVLSIMGLLAKNGRASGHVGFNGQNLLGLSAADLNKVRGVDIAMIFQDPMTALNPYLRISRQMTEVLIEHRGADAASARKKSLELLDLVGIPDSKSRIDLYPHEFSGGMRQRVMIAMALLCEPKLLVADEPTTALDVTVQAQILELLQQIRREREMAILLITHDLGVIAGLADRVLVMYGGRIVEEGPVNPVFATPAHPYTQGLLHSSPRLDETRGGPARHHPRPAPKPPGLAQRLRIRPALQASLRAMRRGAEPCLDWSRQGQSLPPGGHTVSNTPLLQVDDLSVHFPVRTGGIVNGQRRTLKAVDGVSFSLRAGETLGIVGESGCGKSTLGRAILRLIEPTAGRVAWLGEELGALGSEDLRAKRRDMQIIFQDPLASLNPRMTIGSIIAEPLITHQPGLTKAEIEVRVRTAMDETGLLPTMINRYPHEFSGGQCQRVGIARAMILRPKLIVCDEPVSALDVSIQGQIINLLMKLQQEFGLSLLFISHDLSVVRHISHHILVLYLGKIMEVARRDGLYLAPRHPYTQALISAVPIPDPMLERKKKRIVLEGDLPSPLNPPSGCIFRTRCRHATKQCAEKVPALEGAGEGHEVACHHWQTLAPRTSE